jgi:hypothetical protein
MQKYLMLKYVVHISYHSALKTYISGNTADTADDCV